MVTWTFQKSLKNQQKKKIITLSKPEIKINKVPVLKKQIEIDNQVLGMSFNRESFLDYVRKKI